MRGSILDTSPRASMQYWLYLRLSKDYNRLNFVFYFHTSISHDIVFTLVNIGALVTGLLWMKEFYTICLVTQRKEIVLSKSLQQI